MLASLFETVLFLLETFESCLEACLLAVWTCPPNFYSQPKHLKTSYCISPLFQLRFDAKLTVNDMSTIIEFQNLHSNYIVL